MARPSFANIPGYYVGGKTGTADKIIHGHYSQNKVFTTFMAITPADKPKYLYLTIYDDPQAAPEDGGYHTAAYNAGRVAGRADPSRRAAGGRAADEGAAKSAVPHHRPTGVWSRRRQDRQGVTGDEAAWRHPRSGERGRPRSPRARSAGIAFDSRKVAAGRRLLRARRREGRRPRACRRGAGAAAPRPSSPNADAVRPRRAPSSGSPTPAPRSLTPPRASIRASPKRSSR